MHNPILCSSMKLLCIIFLVESAEPKAIDNTKKAPWKSAGLMQNPFLLWSKPTDLIALGNGLVSFMYPWPFMLGYILKGMKTISQLRMHIYELIDKSNRYLIKSKEGLAHKTINEPNCL